MSGCTYIVYKSFSFFLLGKFALSGNKGSFLQGSWESTIMRCSRHRVDQLLERVADWRKVYAVSLRSPPLVNTNRHVSAPTTRLSSAESDNRLRSFHISPGNRLLHYPHLSPFQKVASQRDLQRYLFLNKQNLSRRPRFLSGWFTPTNPAHLQEFGCYAPPLDYQQRREVIQCFL